MNKEDLMYDVEELIDTLYIMRSYVPNVYPICIRCDDAVEVIKKLLRENIVFPDDFAFGVVTYDSFGDDIPR